MKTTDLMKLSKFLASKHELIFQWRGGHFHTLTGIDLDNNKVKSFEANGAWFDASDIKPVLRPMSDWIKNIEHNGEKFIPITRIQRFVENHYTIKLELKDDQNPWELPAFAFELLISWGFDVDGWIDFGMALNRNTDYN